MPEAESNKKALISLKKANSLLKKIQQMLENNKYCIDIIQQNLAVIGLIKSANLQILKGHLNSCVSNTIKKKDTKKLDEMMKELLKVIKIAQN